MQLLGRWQELEKSWGSWFSSVLGLQGIPASEYSALTTVIATEAGSNVLGPQRAPGREPKCPLQAGVSWQVACIYLAISLSRHIE
jgi:hypothetical protein